MPEVEALADHLRRHTVTVGLTTGRIDVSALSVLKTFDPPMSWTLTRCGYLDPDRSADIDDDVGARAAVHWWI